MAPGAVFFQIVDDHIGKCQFRILGTVWNYIKSVHIASVLSKHQSSWPCASFTTSSTDMSRLMGTSVPSGCFSDEGGIQYFLRSLDRGKGKMTGFHGNTHGIISDFLNDFLMNFRITDNTFLSNFFSACLKLRFDKTYDLSIFCEKISYRKKNFVREIKETSIEENAAGPSRSSGTT